MAAAQLAAGPPALVVVPSGTPSWRELYDAADRVFPLAAFFHSGDPPETLLTKLARTSLESPVMVALILDEALDSILLLKNPRRYIGSLLNPPVLDGLVYGFAGPDVPKLTAVHILMLAFETAATYNVIDDPVAMWASLEALPGDQKFHPYVNVGTPHMSNLLCRCALLLPVKWHARLAQDHPFGVGLKAFYDSFLAPLSPAKVPTYANLFIW